MHLFQSEVSSELVLGPGREMCLRIGHREVGLQVILDDLVEGRLLRPLTSFHW